MINDIVQSKMYSCKIKLPNSIKFTFLLKQKNEESKEVETTFKMEIKVNLILSMLAPTVQPVVHKIQNNARKTEHTIRKSIFTKFTANT